MTALLEIRVEPARSIVYHPRMGIRALVVACAFVVIGCRDELKEIDRFADRGCACKDTACASRVLAEFMTWAEAHPRARGDEDAATKSAIRMFKCMIDLGVPESARKDATERLLKLDAENS